MLSAAAGQRGVTLVELMIASVIGLTAIAAVMSVYLATVRHADAQLGNAHLQHQLDSILQLMTTDMRRAGFWQFDAAAEAVTNNPFTTPDNRIQTGRAGTETADSCVLLSYDLDKDGQLGIGKCRQHGCTDHTDSDNVEQFGFRLRAGSVQSRYAGETFSCDAGYWQALNAADIAITDLSFTLFSQCTNLYRPGQPCDGSGPELLQHAVNIKLSAELVGKPASHTERERWVLIRNAIVEDHS